MSARVESPQIRSGYLVGPIVMALLVAITVGALAGSLITRSIIAVDDRTPAAPVIEANAQTPYVWPGRVLVATGLANATPTTWDTQKLDAMAGRALSRPVAVRAEVATTAKPSSTRPGPAIGGWDAGKLEAMKGRVLAARVGAEDPPVSPHLPKRPPRS